MHFTLGWRIESQGEAAAAAAMALRACFEDFPSAEVLPGLCVIQVAGHGQQERILGRLAAAAESHAAANLQYVTSPLIIGGLYQGRLFDAAAAERVNELTDEPD